MADENVTTKASGFIQKHKKGAMVVGGIAVVFVLYLFLRSRSASGNSSSSGTPADSSSVTDPNAATGFNPANGVLTGPTGPAGPVGATGARGPAGRVSIWQEAKQRLIARGILHPTQKQINAERSRILASSAPPKPPKRMHPLNPQAPVSPAVTTAARTQFHTVQPGATTASVAAKHGMQPSTVHGMNGNVVGHKEVMAGQRVRVK